MTATARTLPSFPFGVKSGGNLKISLMLAIAFWSVLALTLAIEEIFFVSWARTSAFAISSTIFVAIIALGWVLAHADENGIALPRALKLAVVALPPVAVPYYRFRYFGARSGFIFLAWLLTCFVALLAVLTLTDYLVNGATARGVAFAASVPETGLRFCRSAGVSRT